MSKNQNVRKIFNKELAIVLFNQLIEPFFETCASNAVFVR